MDNDIAVSERVKIRHTEFMRKYRSENREKYNAYLREYHYKNKEKLNARTRQWFANHPDKKRQNRWAYKVRKKGATIGFVDLGKLIKEWNGICGICKQLVLDTYDIDHIIPLSKGGLHSQENLQITHSICNMKKGNKI